MLSFHLLFPLANMNIHILVIGNKDPSLDSEAIYMSQTHIAHPKLDV